MLRTKLVYVTAYLIAFTGIAPAALAGGFKGGISGARQVPAGTKATTSRSGADRASAVTLAKLIRSGLISRYQAMRVGGQPARVKELLKIAGDARAVGVREDRVSHYQDLYANDPTAEALRELRRQMAVEGMGLPKEALETSLSGLEMVELLGAANALGGDIGLVRDPATWRRVATEGIGGAHMAFLKVGLGSMLPRSAFELGDVPSILEGMGVGSMLGGLDDPGFWGDFLAFKTGGMSQADLVRRNVSPAVWDIVAEGYGGDAATNGGGQGSSPEGDPSDDHDTGAAGTGPGMGGGTGATEGSGSSTGSGDGNGSTGGGDNDASSDSAAQQQSDTDGSGTQGNGEPAGQAGATGGAGGSDASGSWVRVTQSFTIKKTGESEIVYDERLSTDSSDSSDTDSSSSADETDVETSDDAPPEDVDEYTPNPEQAGGGQGTSLDEWLALLQSVDNAEEFTLGFKGPGDVDPSEDDFGAAAAEGAPRDPDGIRGRFGEGMGPNGMAMEDLFALADQFRRGDRPDDGVTDPSNEG